MILTYIKKVIQHNNLIVSFILFPSAEIMMYKKISFPILHKSIREKLRYNSLGDVS